MLDLQGASVAAESIAWARRTSCPALRRRLVGELDEIVLRALHKNPNERQSTVAELTFEIAAHLERPRLLTRWFEA